MHDGCSGGFTNGQEIIDKVRSMGFDQEALPAPLFFTCSCGTEQEMLTFAHKCQNCGMVHGVTPCHAFDPENILEAGINY